MSTQIHLILLRSKPVLIYFAEYEVSFLRLLDKLCNGSKVSINHTGTAVLFKPGMVIGGKPFTHDCGTLRSIGYFLEGVLCLSLYAKNAVSITFTGITNEEKDPSVCKIFNRTSLIFTITVYRLILFARLPCRCLRSLGFRMESS